MDLKHTTKAELAEENAALKKFLSDAERQRDEFNELAERQSRLLNEWECTCNKWRGLYYGCRNHPWRNLWRYLTVGAVAEND